MTHSISMIFGLVPYGVSKLMPIWMSPSIRVTSKYIWSSMTLELGCEYVKYEVWIFLSEPTRIFSHPQ